MPYADTLQIYASLRKEFDEEKAKVIATSIEAALETNNRILLDIVATKEDIANLRAEIKEDMANLKTEMANQKAEIIRWNFIFWVGLLPVMAALIKFIR